MEVLTVKKKLEALNADIKIDDKRVQEAVKKVMCILLELIVMMNFKIMFMEDNI